jgi:tRNA pseudouridine55 synthase
LARTKKGDPVSGWVCLDKPYDMGSTDAVSKIRRLFNAQKAGHAGTLDPLASGILPIALGEATKTVPYLMEADKVYRFRITWGQTTNTYDAEGAVTATSEVRPDEAAIRDVLPAYVGDIKQVPPAFSAIKVDGKRAYDLAREGIEVELGARIVRVFDLRLEAIISPDEAEFILHCGKGTYVRSLARDICLDLGACGHVSYLRRERVGAFDLTNTKTLDNLTEMVHRAASLEALLPVETALDDIPALPVTEDEAFKLKRGQALTLLPRQVELLKSAFEIRREAGRKEHLRTVQARHEGEAQALCELRAGQLWPTRILNP